MKNKKINDNLHQGLSNAPISKKIGFFSTMMIVVGSSIGAGIFFKANEVLTNSYNSVIFAIFSWILAGFAIICMGLAIIEITSATIDNLSIIGWCKKFNSRFIYKTCKNFMVYIYMPFTFFVMPYYVIMSFQDASIAFGGSGSFGLGKNNWVIAMIIAILMTTYFVFVSGLSTKIGNIQNWIIVSVKFIPLVLCVIIGIVIAARDGYQGQGNGIDFSKLGESNIHFKTLSPFIGLFMSMAAIFFAYDGFYVSSGLRNQMKQPKKLPLAIIIGLSIVTIIYLAIAIAMSIGSTDGAITGFENWMQVHNIGWLYGVIQILIAIGILGILNGFGMWAPAFYETLIKEEEVPFSNKLMNKTNEKTPLTGALYVFVISLLIIIVFTIIGSLGYKNFNYDGSYIGLGSLYSFADLMSTWTSVIIFMFILFAIIGGLKNRKINKVKVEKSKYFVPFAICSIITIGLPIIFTILQPIVDLVLMVNIKELKSDEIVSRVMTFVVLIIFILVSIIPIFIEDKIIIKKYGSIRKYELDKERKAKALNN